MPAQKLQTICEELAGDDLGLLDRTTSSYSIHDWREWQYESDDSKERVKRHRERAKKRSQKQPVTENVTDCNRYSNEIVTAQNRTEQNRTDTDVTSVTFPSFNIKGPIERAQAIYAETGKPLNDRDWQAFAKEVTVQNADWAPVLECLEHEAAGWSGRQHDKIPFPVNWAKKSPWTRMPEKKQEQTPAESAAKEAEYNAKYAHLLKPIWEQDAPKA